MNKIIHLDADCFFAAVEMSKSPNLSFQPFAVGGSSSGRGVITTCNYLARSFGVKSAMSSAQALRLCPDLKFVPLDMPLYREMSESMFEIFREYSDKIQTVSIDEAFLDVSGNDLFKGSATLIAQDIQQRIRSELNLPISAGIAPLKFLAKIASDWNKPEGIFTVTPEQIPTFLAPLNLRLLPGVGPRTAQKLSSLGLSTCRDVILADPALLYSHFGAYAKRLLDMCSGIDEQEVQHSRSRKSVTVEHTFVDNIASSALLIQQLPVLLERLQLRYESLVSRAIIVKRFVKLRFSDFQRTSIELRVSPNADAFDQNEYEKLVFAARQRSHLPVRLLGLGLRLSESGASQQLELTFE